MIIPKKYGGLEFSAYAHSQVVTKLSTRSSALAVSVMVPNSLGPAELLLHYGTDEQKNHYLPRLAKGIDVPALRPHQPLGRFRCGLHPRLRRGLQGHVAGPGSAGHEGHLGQALHHPGPGVHRARPGLPSLRSPGPAGRQEGYRHHLRPGSQRPPRRGNRHPPLPPERRLPQRSRPGARKSLCPWSSSSAAPRWPARAGAC